MPTGTAYCLKLEYYRMHRQQRISGVTTCVATACQLFEQSLAKGLLKLHGRIDTGSQVLHPLHLCVYDK